MIRTLGDHDVREAERYINDPTLELSSIFGNIWINAPPTKRCMSLSILSMTSS